MERNKIFLSTIGICCIALLGIGFVFSLTIPNVEAGEIVAIYDDNIKLYDSITKEVTIIDLEEKELVRIKLLTPLDNHVSRGYNKVAEYEVNSLESLKLLVSEMELYDKSNSMEEVTRQIDYKVKGTQQAEVNDYETICEEVYNETTKNETQSCIRKISGIHFEDRETWTDLDKVDFLKDEKIIVGLFTEVQKDDKIEWIPTFQINDKTEIRVEEWATWTESLNTDLIFYLKLNDNLATTNVIDNVGIGATADTNTNNLYEASGKISSAFDFSYGNYGMESDGDIGSVPTFSFWFKTPDTSSPDQRLMGNRYNPAEALGDFGLVVTTAGVLRIEAYMPSSTGISGTTTVDDNQWHHVVVMSGTGGLRVYLDNETDTPEISHASTTILGASGSDDFAIGKYGVNGNYYYGYAVIDEFGAWDTRQDLSIVSQLYNNNDGITWTDVFSTCTCAGLNNDWEVNLSDYCILTEDCDLGTGKLNFTGTGNFTCDARIDTTSMGDPTDMIYINDECRIWID